MSNNTNNSTTAPPPPGPDVERRTAVVATAIVGGAGVAALAVPYVASWGPTDGAKAAGAPVDVDVSGIPPGTMRIVKWRGKPVWILHRTPEMIRVLHEDTTALADPDSKRQNYPTPAYVMKDPALRSIRPEFLVVIGICTHLGCSPNGPFPAGVKAPLGPWPGFLCPCHGSTFDLAGRVFKNKPAADNLAVPPYRFLDEHTIRIGEAPVHA